MPSLDELTGDPRKNTRGRFEQWVKNPSCNANTISAVLNVKLADVATHLGFKPEYGQSPFAISRGLQFESWLFREDAKIMREAMVRKKMLSEDSTGFLDLRVTSNGGTRIKTLEQATKESEEFLKSLCNQNAKEVPTIVAGLLIRIPKGVMLPEATLIIDVCTVLKVEDKWEIQVGEIKVYPDRGGFTDTGEISTARAQAGVYQHALEITVEALGSKTPPHVSKFGFLVFTWPGSNSPVIRPNEDLTYQAMRATQGFERLDLIAQDLVEHQSKDLKPIEWVAHAETEYRESCWSFCDLAPRCQDVAIANDSGIVLGTEAAKLLGKSTVSRSIQLLNGAEPTNEVEAELQRVLQDAEWTDPDDY